MITWNCNQRTDSLQTTVRKMRLKTSRVHQSHGTFLAGMSILVQLRRDDRHPPISDMHGSAELLRLDLEHRPISISAAVDRGAVETADAIEDQAGVGFPSVLGVDEGMQQLLGPGTVCQGR